MFKFFRRRRRSKKEKGGGGIIALDLGSDVIKACLFVIEKKQNASGEIIGKRAIIKGYGEVIQQKGELQKGVITDISSVIENCKEAIRKASREARIEPKKLIIGVGGELIKGKTSILKHKREDPKSKINLSELQNMVHKLQWKAFAEVRKEISHEMGHPEIDIKLVDTAIVGIHIDDYKVSNPLGFQGKEVNISIFNCFAPLSHFNALNMIANQLELELLSIASTPYALSRAMDNEKNNASFIFIDVGGGGTNVAVVEKGMLMGAKMFGIGGRTFTKRLAMEMNIATKEAEQLKIAYSEDRLEQKSKKIVADTLKHDVEVWLEGIVLSLSEFKEVKILPSKILLSGKGAKLPEIRENLNNRKWHKKLHFNPTPKTQFIHPKELRQLIDESKSSGKDKNIMVAALAHLGMELADEETMAQKVLRKVIGIMKV